MAIKLTRVKHPVILIPPYVKYSYTDSSGFTWKIKKNEDIPPTYSGHWYIGSIISGENFHNLKEVRSFLARKETDLAVKRTNELLSRIDFNEDEIIARANEHREAYRKADAEATVIRQAEDKEAATEYDREYEELHTLYVNNMSTLPDEEIAGAQEIHRAAMIAIDKKNREARGVAQRKYTAAINVYLVAPIHVPGTPGNWRDGTPYSRDPKTWGLKS